MAAAAGGGLIVLSIGFKRVGERYGIQRTGLGAGDLEARGGVPFVGEAAARWVLTAQGKDMGVLYDQSAEMRRGDMVFTVALDYLGRPTDEVTLPPEIEQQADLVVASFTLAE